MATDALPPPDAPGKTEQLDPAHEASELGIPGRDVSNYKTFGKSLYTEVKQVSKGFSLGGSPPLSFLYG